MNWKKINENQYINIEHTDLIVINSLQEKYEVKFKLNNDSVYYSNPFNTLEEAEKFLDKILERK